MTMNFIVVLVRQTQAYRSECPPSSFIYIYIGRCPPPFLFKVLRTLAQESITDVAIHSSSLLEGCMVQEDSWLSWHNGELIVGCYIFGKSVLESFLVVWDASHQAFQYPLVVGHVSLSGISAVGRRAFDGCPTRRVSVTRSSTSPLIVLHDQIVRCSRKFYLYVYR